MERYDLWPVAMKIIDIHFKTRLPKNNYFNAEL